VKPAPAPVRTNPSNGDLVYLCPLCEDRKGHMQLSVRRGIWHCYRCGRGGSVKALRRETGVEWPLDEAAQARTTRDTGSLEAILEAALGRETARAATGARVSAGVDYSRLTWAEAARVGGLGSAALLLTPTEGVARAHEVGGLPGTFRAALLRRAAAYLSRRGVGEEETAAWGIVVACDPEAGRLRPSRLGRVTWPVYDPQGDGVASWSSRAVADDARPRYAGPASPPQYRGPLLGPLARLALRVGDLGRLVLVEGPVDAMAVERAGISAGACQGKRLGREGAALLAGLGVREVVVMLDAPGADPDTPRAALTLAGDLVAAGVRALIAEPPLGCKDPGEATPGELATAVVLAKPVSFDALL
jgi:DNA primase